MWLIVGEPEAIAERDKTGARIGEKEKYNYLHKGICVSSSRCPAEWRV